MHPFAPLDGILMTAGCKVFTHERKTKISNLLLRSFTVLVFTADLMINLRSVTSARVSRPIVLVEYFMKYLFGATFLVVMTRNASSLATLMTHFLRGLTSEQETELRRLSYVGLSVFVATRILEVTAAVAHLLSINANGWHILSDSSGVVRETTPWLIGGCFVYVFLVRLVSLREENYFTRLHCLLDFKEARVDAAKLVHERCLMNADREELVSCLSVTPVLWFTHIFMKASAAISESINSKHAKAERIATLLPFASEVVVLLYLIRACDYASADIRRRVDQLIVRLAGNRLLESHKVLVKELRVSRDVAFTAWDMFDVNRKLLAPFTASLITFTVLFIQIANAIKAD